VRKHINAAWLSGGFCLPGARPNEGTDMTTKSKKPAIAGALLLVLAAALSACSGTPAGQSSAAGGTAGDAAKTYRIGIAQIVSHPSLDAIREGFKQCMATAGFVDGQNVTYDEQNPQGDQVALTQIANNFKSAKMDMVLAITTPVAQAFAQTITDKPIIFAGVTDPVSAGLIKSWDAPGGNLTGSSDYPPIDDQVKLITDIKPDAKTVGIVYSSGEENAQQQMQMASDALAKIGLTVKTAAVTNSSEVQQAAASLKGVDAFYVGNDNTVVSAIGALIQVAEQQKVPVITADPDSVKAGATAAYAVNQTQMGCEAAKLAVQVLQDGKNPGDIPVVRMADLKAAAGADPSTAPLQLTVNVAAAGRQGVTIPADLLATATQVG